MQQFTRMAVFTAPLVLKSVLFFDLGKLEYILLLNTVSIYTSVNGVMYLFILVLLVNAENDSVNVWMIALPVTGILIVALFAIFCICRYTCRFLSFCSKICDHEVDREKPVKIDMPSHAHVVEVMQSLTPKKSHQRKSCGGKLHSKVQQILTPEEAKHLLASTETNSQVEKSVATIVIKNEVTDINHNSTQEKGPHSKTYCPSLTHETLIINQSSDKTEEELFLSTSADNGVSEIAAPQITITVH